MTSSQTISVLVAARNEDKNIAQCIESLLSQNYPIDKFEILVGDDQSTDRTIETVNLYAEKTPNVHLIKITKNIGGLKGKANVLAQLAHEAKGSLLFITDADMILSPNWINAMTANLTGEITVITGVTAVSGKTIFAKLQNAEWLFYCGHGYYSAKSGKPVTAMGNNMVLTASAYWGTGGYENIPFSVTEDYELFRALLKNGQQFKCLLEADVLGFTKPLPGFNALLKQHRRWFKGAFQLPLTMIVGLLFLWTYFPIILALGFAFDWRIAIVMFFFKWVFDLCFLLKIYSKIQLKPDLGLYFYSPFSMVCNVIFLFFQALPGPIEWKGRKYF